MASEILGLFASPELYQQNQDLLRQQQALQYAQLDPYDRVTYGANLAGQRFGSTLGNVLGGTDPQLRIISARQSVMQGVDPSNPESILKAAQQLADVGDQQGALILADYGRKAGSELALQQQRMREGRAASTPKELQIANATAQLQQRIRELQAAPESLERNAELQIATDTLARLTATTKSANVPKEIEIANARAALQGRIRALEKQPESEKRNDELQTARDTLASLPQAGGRAGQVPDAIEIARELALEAGEPGTEAYNKSYRENLKRLSSKDSSEKQLEFSRILIEAGYTPGTPEYQAEMKRYAMAEITGRSQGKGTQISLGGINLDTGKAGEAAGKKIGEELVDVKGKEAALDSLTEARKMLNNGIYAGAYGPAKQFVAKYTGVGSAEKVANTETFLAFIGETVVPRLKEFGGNDSEQELAYLNKIMGGDITVEPKTLARILDQAEIKIKRGIERLRRQAESGEKKQTLTSTLPPTSAAPAPAPAPAAPAASAAPAAPVTPRPTKRWNPATRKLEAIQ